MVCDSTNAMVEGHSGSEGDVRRSLAALIRELRGRVAVTCFASNVARVESVALAARAAGRSVAVVGRSLRNLEAAARECGYLRGIPPFLGEDEANDVPDDNLLILVTGSQGEPRSALARIAADSHPRIGLGEGDTVVFCSRVIPGNERAIDTVQDNLVRRGVRLMTDADHMIHVSGHPARDELRRLYRLVRPRFSVPVHGEWRHLSAHAALAQEAGVTPVLLEDGDILSLAPGVPEVIDSAPVGRLVLDGARLVPLQGGVMGARRRMLFNGVAIASIAVDEAGRLRGVPRVSAPGLFEADDPETGAHRRRTCRDAGRPAGAAAARRCRRCRRRRARRCAGHSAGGCRSGRWWTCTCCASEGAAMGWFTGVVLYVLIWWVVLFAVLPFGTKAVSEADAASGWRGAPAQVAPAAQADRDDAGRRGDLGRLLSGDQQSLAELSQWLAGAARGLIASAAGRRHTARFAGKIRSCRPDFSAAGAKKPVDYGFPFRESSLAGRGVPSSCRVTGVSSLNLARCALLRARAFFCLASNG